MDCTSCNRIVIQHQVFYITSVSMWILSYT
ncbi:unnamed protein product [Spodoptera exigua]|nr:unnamed protein product [Spodoptera exigua]